MNTVGTIIDEKGTVVHRVAPTATVLDAVKTMCSARVGAIIVCDGTSCVGVFSERDLMTRVILAGKDPAETPVAEVMTSDVVVVERSTTAQEAMAIMTERRCRHLPVVAEGKVSGVVSIGDLVRWQSSSQEFEIRMLTSYITSQYPG